MRVECVFFGPLRERVGEKTVVRDTDAATVGDLLRELEAAYPGLGGRLLAESVDGTNDPSGDEGALADAVAVTLNGTHLQHRDGIATGIAEGDVVRFTTAVYGG